MAKYNEKNWAVYWNTGAGEGGVELMDKTAEGYSDQWVGGPHDNLQGYYATKKEAEQILEKLYEKAGK